MGPGPDAGGSKPKVSRDQAPDMSGISAAPTDAGKLTAKANAKPAIRRTYVMASLSARLEIRSFGFRYLRASVVVVFMRVLGADILHPIGAGLAIGRSAAPRHGEIVVVFHRELHLQSLAFVVGVDGRGLLRSNAAIGPHVALLGCARDFVIDQPIPLYHMQPFAVGRAVLIDLRDASDFEDR